MAPKPIWTGSISFGLVNVPVKLFSATAKKDVHFHQLHAADNVRIQQKRICPADGQEVPYEDVVKGYEISRNEYVVITREELEAIDPKATGTIAIEDFVDLSAIDPVYFEHTYYLAPDKGAEKAYVLLLTAMKNLNKCAIAKVVIRQKQYLAAVRPVGDLLSLATLLFADEIIDPAELGELPFTDAALDNRQLSIAEQIIDTQSTEFKADKYHDEYRETLLEVLAEKAKGMERVVQPPLEKKGAKVVDLMSALEASLAAAKEKRPKARGAGKKSA